MNKIRHFQVPDPARTLPETEEETQVSNRVSPNSSLKKKKKSSTPTILEKSAPIEKKKKSHLGFWIAGSILVTVGLVSQIRVHPSIRAEAWLEPNPEAREMVHAKIPGIVTEVLVQSNEPVRADRALAIVESEQLEEEIGNWTLRLQESLVATESSRQQMFSSQARLNQIQQQYNFARDRAAQLQGEIARMESGAPPPHIQGYQTQIQNLQATEASLSKSLDRFRGLVEEGAIAEEQVEEVKRRKLAIAAQIGQNRSALETAKRQLQDELKAKTDELNRLQTSLSVARQEYNSAQVLVRSRQPIETQIQQEIEKRAYQKQEHYILRAPIDGTVVTPDIFSLKGKFLQAGELVMEIADTSQLVAAIEVRQEDRDLVKAGSEVKFKPLEPGLPSFTTTIKEIVTVLERNEQLQKSTLQVTALIDSTEGKLQPNAKVYAKIKSPHKIPLYEQARREMLNLLKFRKYS
ncbi:MAG: HlyD family efflux transporter periplasmic adaptor subunit [Cyanobacteria bacterium SBLK]|nr:HlyD family efflux transporter periplasmic adaptor subunit [Cyanobacteria bacterium SBLK]